MNEIKFSISRHNAVCLLQPLSYWLLQLRTLDKICKAAMQDSDKLKAKKSKQTLKVSQKVKKQPVYQGISF